MRHKAHYSNVKRCGGRGWKIEAGMDLNKNSHGRSEMRIITPGEEDAQNVIFTIKSLNAHVNMTESHSMMEKDHPLFNR